jgi:hypothetical protein
VRLWAFLGKRTSKAPSKCVCKKSQINNKIPRQGLQKVTNQQQNPMSGFTNQQQNLMSQIALLGVAPRWKFKSPTNFFLIRVENV